MAAIVYSHPSNSKYAYHIYTDLDFWDTRHLVGDLATVKRNFGSQPSGDEFPAQVVAASPEREVIREIERRIREAVVSPPRHVIVRSILLDGFFEFDPSQYFPKHWSRDQMLLFFYKRLPLEQGALNSPYQTVKLFWAGGRIRVVKVQRDAKHDPTIRTPQEALQRLDVPSCF